MDYTTSGISPKIHAIKWLREAVPGLGLHDAKTIVEAAQQDAPDVIRRLTSDAQRDIATELAGIRTALEEWDGAILPLKQMADAVRVYQGDQAETAKRIATALEALAAGQAYEFRVQRVQYLDMPIAPMGDAWEPVSLAYNSAKSAFYCLLRRPRQPAPTGDWEKAWEDEAKRLRAWLEFAETRRYSDDSGPDCDGILAAIDDALRGELWPLYFTHGKGQPAPTGGETSQAERQRAWQQQEALMKALDAAGAAIKRVEENRWMGWVVCILESLDYGDEGGDGREPYRELLKNLHDTLHHRIEYGEW